MLETKLTKTLLRTTDNYIKSLEKAGLTSVGEMINLYPKDYEDRSNIIDTYSYINIKEKNIILVTLLNVVTERTGNNKIITKAVFEDKNGFLAEGVWFNQKYFGDKLKNYVGKKVIVSSKVKYAYGKISFQSPDVEMNLEKVSGEIVPLYSDVNYIPGSWIHSKMGLLQEYFKYIRESLPEEIIKKYNFIPKNIALEKLHFPKNQNDVDVAKYRLAYEELFEINYKAISKKIKNFEISEGKSISIALDAELVKEIISNLPFELTNHQKIVLFQVLKDIESNHSMQRLLEGDVGTGKTIVAQIAIIHSILECRKKGNNIQVAIMVPTEILARQHFEGMQDLFLQYNISSNLLIGSLTKKQKDSLKIDLREGNLDVVIGTHALVQEDVIFKNLGFVIIDEQHRFGVKQREVLESGLGNRSGIIPHNLNMTATPIPRTLALTLYGDQDLSIISEYPKNRKIIFTKVAKNDDERHQIELFIRNELEKGRQVFWISPLVEESEKIDLANAVNTYESLTEIFSPFRVGLLHGKMKASEKEEVMREFSQNKVQVLSSTSVVEVGINVPNATIMCIEGAERFGLSQLHQFRGRVGRGEHKSYCYLFSTNGNSTDRLKAMEKTNNGFELAEIDLELRGPGEVYGVRQSGVPEFKIADIKDLELVSQIREDIEEMFKEKIKK